MLWGSQVRSCIEAPLSAFRGVNKELQVPERRSTQTRNRSDSWRKRRSWWGVTAGDSWRSEVRKWAWKQQRSGGARHKVTGTDLGASDGLTATVPDWHGTKKHQPRGGGGSYSLYQNKQRPSTGWAGPCRWEAAHGLGLGQTCYVTPPSRLLLLPNWSLFSR